MCCRWFSEDTPDLQSSSLIQRLQFKNCLGNREVPGPSQRSAAARKGSQPMLLSSAELRGQVVGPRVVPGCSPAQTVASKGGFECRPTAKSMLLITTSSHEQHGYKARRHCRDCRPPGGLLGSRYSAPRFQNFLGWGSTPLSSCGEWRAR